MRLIMRTQQANERIQNFQEVALGFSKEEALEEASRCLECKNAPCKKGCPVGVDIPGFVGQLKIDNIEQSLCILKKDNSMPAVCGRVCPQERQCEQYCVRKSKLGGSVAIGALERYVADYGLSCEYSDINIEMTDKKVAIVGSGPASLTCAGDLIRNGVNVTIFEALHKTGGVLVYGIPEFRLPKAIVQKEIDAISALGVKIETNVVVGKTIFIEELLNEFDAVFIGSGAGLPMFMNIEGENLNGVYSANEYLTRVNLMKAYENDSITPLCKGKRVVVVGAGNVAMDSARTARRFGAEVYLVYRRGWDEMPARAEEILHAEEEGIIFKLFTNPVKILGENGKVRGITCLKMAQGEPDASGRKRPVVIKGSDFDIECDEVIIALGTSPNPIIKNSCNELKTSKWGTIETDSNGLTSVDRLYAGGDAQTGAATVILAMGAGRNSASAMLKKLGLK